MREAWGEGSRSNRARTGQSRWVSWHARKLAERPGAVSGSRKPRRADVAMIAFGLGQPACSIGLGFKGSCKGPRARSKGSKGWEGALEEFRDPVRRLSAFSRRGWGVFVRGSGGEKGSRQPGVSGTGINFLSWCSVADGCISWLRHVLALLSDRDRQHTGPHAAKNRSDSF